MDRPEHIYKPIVTGVRRDDRLYLVVTISAWPGGSAEITLVDRGLTPAEAAAEGLRQWEYVSTLIEGRLPCRQRANQ